MEEKLVTLNLRQDLLKYPRWKRSKRAVKLLKEKLSRILHTEKVEIDQALNELFWKKGSKNPPAKIKVKVAKEGDTYKAFKA